MLRPGDLQPDHGPVFPALDSGEVTVDPSLENIPPDVRALYTLQNNGMGSDYVNYGALQLPHIQQSQEEIGQTAALALKRAPQDRPRRALILGSGNGLDIPLKALLAEFDQTVVVDIDTTNSEAALRHRLPLALLGKVSLVGADVTGVVGEFTATVRRLASEQPTHEGFLAAFATATQTMDLNQAPPELGRGYDFVCSQLLLSQLAVVPQDVMVAAAEARYPKQLRTVEGVLAQATAFDNFNMSLRRAHLHLLARTVAESGAVYFADTYVRSGVDSGVPSVLTMVSEEVVNPVLERHFRPTRPQKLWVWNANPLTTYAVVSHSLVPNTSIT
jgi:hypothetical protein